ncbi:MAG: hypothetical protein RLZ12_536 [Bacillota bacterium]|jgi:hypothetical protein
MQYTNYHEQPVWLFTNAFSKSTKQSAQAKSDLLKNKYNAFLKKFHGITHAILANKQQESTNTWINLAKDFIDGDYLSIPLDLIRLEPERRRAELELSIKTYPDLYSKEAIQDYNNNIHAADLLKKKVEALYQKK